MLSQAPGESWGSFPMLSEQLLSGSSLQSSKSWAQLTPVVFGGRGGTCWGPVLIWVVCAGGPGVMTVVTGVGGAVPSIPELDWESFRQLSGSDSQVLFLLALWRPKPTCLAGITHAGYRLHRLGMRHRKSRQEDL